MRQEYFLALLGETPLPAFPGVLELITAGLNRDDFRLAIATSSTREKSEAVLRSACIPYHQMAYVTGSDVKRKKPEPELFLTAAGRLELDPVCCLVVEDAPNGIEAAKAAGCKCMAVTNTAREDKLSAADRVTASLAEITLEDVIALLHS